MAQISPIKFSKELQKQLFPDNDFYKKSRVETGIGADVESVEIPIAGDVGSALSGNPVLPVPINARTDNKKSYTVEQLYTKPYLVTREEDIVLNYDKVSDLAQTLSMSINTRAGNIAATEWGATLASNIVRTTGSGRATSVTGTTGNRKAIVKANMLDVRKLFNKMNLPSLGKDSLWGLLTPEMVDDLLNIPEFVDYDKTGEISKLKNGEIAYINGFNLMMRNNDIGSVGVMYSNAGTPVKRTVDETLAATDNAAAIFWHKAMVRHAEGHAETIINRKPAGYLGATIIESVVRFGATFDRTDQKGIVALVEDNV
jgi:hypothetical protein